MKRLTKIITFVMSVMVLCCSFGNVAMASTGVSIVQDADMRFVTIPNTYEVETTYKNLEEYGFLNHAEDLFMDEQDNLYVADSGNNRVLKIAEGKVVAEYTEAFGVALKNPKGVYVHEDETIWIADTDNYRVVRINQDGSDVEAYYRPESELLEDSFTFAAQKIYMSNTGYMYVLCGTNLMKMDAKNDFRGYVGAATVPFSLSRLLIRMFGTQSQIERTVKQEPSAYDNFMIASDGMIYGLMSNEKTGQIRRLNSVGTNTYPEEFVYGFEITLDDTNYTGMKFSDITVMDNGVITVCDRNTGLIYQYDQDGDLLAVFGGTGDKKGVYTNLVSIVHDSEGRLYALDYTANNITVLAPTKFIELVHEAVSLYQAGDYDAAKSYWEQVLEIDSNYALARSGYGKVLFKEGRYKEAMDQYTLGSDREGYSDAFAEYRHDMFRNYFGWVCLAVVVLLGGFWFGFKKIQKYVNEIAHRIEYGGWL